MKERIQVIYQEEDISSEVVDYEIDPLIHGVNCIRLCDNTYMTRTNNITLHLVDGTTIRTNPDDCDITVFIDEEGD